MDNRIKKYFIFAVPLFIVLAILGVSVPMIGNIGTKMESSAANSLVNATYIIENSVNSKLKNDMEALSGIISSGIEMDSESLKLFCKGSGFFRVNVVDRNGIGFDSDGNAIDLEKLNIEMPVLLNENPIISKYYYAQSGRRALAFSVPLMKDGKIEGAVFAERYVEDYYSSTDFSFFDGEGRGYILDAETGEFIIRSLSSDNLSNFKESIFDNLEAFGNDRRIVDQVRDMFANGNTGTALVQYNGKESDICFTPVSENSKWYLATIIARDDLMAESTEIRQSIIIIYAVVTLGLLAALGAAFAIIMAGRKETERKKRMELLENITSTVSHGFVVYNPASGEVEYASNNLARLFGINYKLVRKDVNTIFQWLGVSEENEKCKDFRDGTLKDYYEMENCIQDGDKARWVRIEVSPGSDGKYVVVITDVTKDKEYAKTLSMAMENAENANKAKSRFLSNMSHDIRTPMNGIIGMTAIAAANVEDTNRVKDCLKKISDASVHLLNLINEVLDMSKIENGMVTLNEKEFNLGDAMYGVLDVNHAAIEAKNQVLSVHIADVQHENVIADQVKLQQIMTNIVSNANKYTREGGTIEIALTEKPANIKGYGCYEFVCRDNGIGMDSEFVKKIFKPFERAKDSINTEVQGTGLGMAIVKNIVDMMGGIIKVSSAPGEGSVFTVILNLKLQGNEETGQMPPLPVLVVDDDEAACENALSLLYEIGMSGEGVYSGREALERCVKAHEESRDYFAVILDWKMPGMDGIETARQIRKKVGTEVPIIILTAYNYEQVEKEAREAGVTEFLPKPLFRTKLYQKMRHLVLNEEEPSSDIRKFASNVDFRGKRILLAEDNELNMEIAINLLEFTGVEIDSAYNGKEALDKYMSKPEGYYDLILMDIQMPVMDGYKTTEVIRDSGRTDAEFIPIVAMTANAFMEDRERAREAGMNGYIPKPVDVQNLVDTISLCMETRRDSEDE